MKGRNQKEYEKIKNTFVSKLLELINKKGFSKTRIAEEINEPVSTVTQHTNGNNIPYFLYTLYKYSEILKVPLDYLVKGTEPAPLKLSELRELINGIEIEAIDETSKEDKDLLKLIKKVQSKRPTVWSIVNEILKMTVETEEDVEAVVRKLKEIPNKEVRDAILKWFLSD